MTPDAPVPGSRVHPTNVTEAAVYNVVLQPWSISALTDLNRFLKLPTQALCQTVQRKSRLCNQLKSTNNVNICKNHHCDFPDAAIKDPLTFVRPAVFQQFTQGNLVHLQIT